MLREGPMIDAHRVTLTSEDDFEGWRDAARDLAEAGVPPDAVVWRVEGQVGDLFGTEAPQPKGASFAVPRAFIVATESASSFGASPSSRFSLVFAAAMTIGRSGASILFQASLVTTTAPYNGATRTSSMYFASRKICSYRAR